MNHKNTTIHMLAIHVDKAKMQNSLIKTSVSSSYTISEYLHMIVQQCAYRTTILIKLSFSWKCLAKCIMDKGVLPGILVCSEIFWGGMCISGGNANTIHNINLFSSNPHNNYSINEKKWTMKNKKLSTVNLYMYND